MYGSAFIFVLLSYINKLYEQLILIFDNIPT